MLINSDHKTIIVTFIVECAYEANISKQYVTRSRRKSKMVVLLSLFVKCAISA